MNLDHIIIMTILGCVFQEHDFRLVILAALVCVSGCWSTLSLFQSARSSTSMERACWLMLTAVLAGSSIWSTHFISILGYQAGMSVQFDPVLTILSLLIAIVGSGIGFAIAAHKSIPYGSPLGGAVLGLAIATMHYTGMSGYRVPGFISWHSGYFYLSLAFSIVLSSIFTTIASAAPGANRPILATTVFVSAIVLLHFTGMTAFRVEPPLVGGEATDTQHSALAMSVASVAIIVLAAGIATQFIDRKARSMASEALTSRSHGMVIVESSQVILFNQRVFEILGLEPQDLFVGMPFIELQRSIGARLGWEPAYTQHSVETQVTWLKNGENGQIDVTTNGGSMVLAMCQQIGDGRTLFTYEDVTESRKHQKNILDLTFQDPLTGLWNRYSLTRELELANDNECFALLVIDLDRFKTVNEAFGYLVGDALLAAVARRLSDCCSPADLIFRCGGDELAVLTRLSETEATQLATNIIDAIARPYQIQAQTISISCSIGVAFCDAHVDGSLRQQMAELALGKAKAGGKSRVEVYRNGMIEEAELWRALELDLSRALGSDQIFLVYQPLFELPERTLVGFEALVRWRHPTRGLVPPSVFIPIAEQAGSIVELGAWITDEACRQASLWPTDIYISLNVSPIQLLSTSFHSHLIQALGRHDINSARLEIEITETAMVDDNGKIASALTSLRARGVRVAMDDFGTGYSSLAHLQEFEVDRIKIDRSFISSARTDLGAAAVVRAVTGLARDLKIKTTGEGVECEEQLDMLIEFGCSTAQGYFLGRPLDIETATTLVDQHLNLSSTGVATRV